MSGSPAPVRDDPELGTVRRCTRCEEEWPLDEEFFYFQVRHGRRVPSAWCIACWSERSRERWAARCA